MHGLLAYIPLQCDQMKVWGHAEDSPRVNIINPRLWDVSLRIKTRVITPSHNSSVTMKEVLLRIDDSALDQFLGFIQLCPTVEVMNVADGNETQELIDQCFKLAIELLQINNVFRKPGDYSYIMKAVNEGELSDVDPFFSPAEYIDYMSLLGIDNLPGKSTIYDNLQKIEGAYPNWTYKGEKKEPVNREILRRKNIVVQFKSAFFKAKRELSEPASER